MRGRGTGALAVLLALATCASGASVYAQEAPPAPSTQGPPSTSPIAEANARPLEIETQLGVQTTITGEAGTSVTPTAWVSVEGPLALGQEHSFGRLGARLGISSSPGSTADLTSLENYSALEVGLWAGRVIGSLGNVNTTLVVEGSFSSRLKGGKAQGPLDRLSRSLGVGVHLDARHSHASFAGLVGYDEASATCSAPTVCTGVHSGLAFIVYGQAPILQGAVLFVGDVTISTGPRVAWLERHDVERVGIVADPIAAVKAIQGGNQPAAAPRSPALRLADELRARALRR